MYRHTTTMFDNPAGNNHGCGDAPLGPFTSTLSKREPLKPLDFAKALICLLSPAAQIHWISNPRRKPSL